MDSLSQYFHFYNRFFWSEIITAGGFEDEESANREINLFLAERNTFSRHNAVTNLISLFNRFSEECLVISEVKTKDKTLNQLLKMYDFYLESLKVNERVIMLIFHFCSKKRRRR